MESTQKQRAMYHKIYRPVNSANPSTGKLVHLPQPADKSGKVPQRNVGSRDQLVDILNYNNFQGSTVLAVFKHKKFNRSVRRSLFTKICHGSRLDCVWANPAGIQQILKTYTFQNLLISEENNLLYVVPEVIGLDQHEISFALPDTYTEIGKRKVKRHPCTGVDVQMVQEGSIYSGILAEFTPLALKVRTLDASRLNPFEMNPDCRVSTIFSSQDQPLYSGDCKILRQRVELNGRSYILEPVNHQIQRFKPDEYRSLRHKLVPAPDIFFKHPFTGETIQRKVINISGSGFRTEESEESSLLLPGMIIPDLEVKFAGGGAISCTAQVVYRKLSGKNTNGNLVQCGIAIIDINPSDHMKLMSILRQVENDNADIDSKIDIDASWRFFFKTELIKPERYAAIQAEEDKIEETYKRLYGGNHDIARHFIYQPDSDIKGHTAILRFYQNSWLIHHEAAGSPINATRLGALNLVSRFIHDSSRFASLHMDYVLHYFDQTDEFSDLIFKGGAGKIDDPKGCSLDSMAYFRYRNGASATPKLSGPWRLAEAVPQDLIELENSYRASSKGLMLKALDLTPHAYTGRELSAEYEKLGLRRRKFLFSLKQHDTLKAVVMLNLSDAGLNVSDLTKCVTIFVLDQEYLPQEVLSLLLSQILREIKRHEIPVWLFPASYADEHAVPVEKLTYLWILNTQWSDRFLNHLDLLSKK